MIKNYRALKVGDRVRFSVRHRKKPVRVEYFTGRALHECLCGWRVRINEVTLADYFVSDNNYIGHYPGTESPNKERTK